jgi:uncharacterized protein
MFRHFVLVALFPAALAAQSAEDLVLVDCRLPAKQRRIGGRTYPVPGRTVRTTAVDCRIRGGDYTVYDRANYQTSLKVWQAAAEKGDHDAEYYLGKIYEDGLGTAPDYAQAARWYEKAAAAGHTASQFSLATLYEKSGDKQKALDFYRRASGLTDAYTIVETSRYEELQRAAEQLALREQEIDELRKQQKKDEKQERELLQQIDALKKNLTKLRSEVRASASVAAGFSPPSLKLGGLKSAATRFHALVIGNAQYANLPPVPTAKTDAEAMAALLRDDYGFQVTTLLNATNAQILSKLYQLSQTLGENDNLVVYYAGHGKRDLRNRRGWWLPADAGADSGAKTNWLPNQEVSDRLALIAARHILVLADASYVGDITRGAPMPETAPMSAAQWTKYVEATKARRARLALASGADEPSGTTSRFTAALIEAMKKQKGVVPASRIHRDVVNALTADERVTSAVPTFAPLQSAFHDGVDFLFERK